MKHSLSRGEVSEKIHWLTVCKFPQGLILLEDRDSLKSASSFPSLCHISLDDVNEENPASCRYAGERS